MKICFACSQTLPKERFSKKQWQLKKQRRCKECIANKREVTLEEAPNDAQPPRSGADGDEGALSLTDEDLFKQPPPKEECPICMLSLPSNYDAQEYQSCCGKIICSGCICADFKESNRMLCPFCRTPPPTSNGEIIERLKERAWGDDTNAIRNLGCYYREGKYGLRQNFKKATKLWFRAGELGCTEAYNNIGSSYYKGEGVGRDTNKAKYYYELAAVGGSVQARHNLGALEGNEGNAERAVKHWMISAGAGHDNSLAAIRAYFLRGHATKDEFERALRAHKEAKDEMKSVQRKAAAAYYDEN